MENNKQPNNTPPFDKNKKPMRAIDRIDGTTVKRLLGYLGSGYRGWFILVLFFIILSSLAGVIGSVFIGRVVDDYITPMLSQAVPDFAPLLKAVCIMGGAYFIGMCGTFLYNFIMVNISQGIQKDIRDEMFAKMQRLPIKYFDTHAHGDIMSHYTNDIDTLRQMLSQSIPQAFSSLITIVSVFCAMVYTNPLLTVLVIITVLLMLQVTKYITRNSGKYFIGQQRAVGKVNGYIEEMMYGQKVIKVFNHEEAVKKEFDVVNENLFENATKAHTFANILMPIMGNLGFVQYAFIAVIGAIMIISGFAGGNSWTALTLGELISFLSLSRSFNMPINQISQQINNIVMALAGAKRIFALMDEMPEIDEGSITLVNVKEGCEELIETKEHTERWAWRIPIKNRNAQCAMCNVQCAIEDDFSAQNAEKSTLEKASPACGRGGSCEATDGEGSVPRPSSLDPQFDYIELKGDVRLDHVNFEYEPGKPILKDINIYAEPGQKLALVGATGAGKTTITNLINRFYDIQDGTITYDGIPIRAICKKDLRRSLGIVLQDVNLFTGTIMENLRYGNLDATDEEIIAAAKLANAHEFIMRMPDGYNTMIDATGGSLSQGQCQLVSIARAAVADPPVMILDEATSSIDTRTEALVQAGMDSLMVGRTVFVIAHRLSTIQNADAIMVMDHGRIIERGTHDSLIAKGGTYYRLYTGALELE